MLAILAFFLWTRLDQPSGLGAGEQERFTEVVLSGLPKLLERWQEGDLEEAYGSKLWSCDELPESTHVAPAYFQCNQHYLECWARGKTGASPSIPVTIDGVTYQLKLGQHFPKIEEFSAGKRHSQFVTRSELQNPIAPWQGVLIDIEVEGMKGHWRMILEDTCRMKELPQRRYSYGARPDRHERLLEMDWDNDGRKIFIDKFPVARSDVNQWVLATAPSQVKFQVEKKTWALPSTDLSVDQQVAYCAWLGKRRMEAHLWDAATMSPSNLARPFPDFIVKPWLPWSRDRRDSFFELAETKRDWKPTASDCSLAYVKECQDAYPYRPHSTDNVSWMGIYHVLGGTPEEFRNPVESKLTLKASSVLLEAYDHGHQLGRRLEGTGHAAAFRCYREEFP